MQQMLTQLHNLRLSGIAEALQQQREQPNTYVDLSFEERLELLVAAEVTYRDDRRLIRLLRAAKLKLSATMSDIDYQHPRGLKKNVMAGLAAGDWLVHYQNLLITGPCGSGKSYIACALGHHACLQGHAVRYFRTNRLLDALGIARVDGSYTRLLNQLAKTELLILDDFGLEPLKQTQRNDLLEIMDDRYGHHSTLVSSQLPTSEWHASIGDATLADAILDRLMHNAHRIELKGTSLRKKMSKLDSK
jgi:DNA replication protein DnaC